MLERSWVARLGNAVLVADADVEQQRIQFQLQLLVVRLDHATTDDRSAAVPVVQRVPERLRDDHVLLLLREVGVESQLVLLQEVGVVDGPGTMGVQDVVGVSHVAAVDVLDPAGPPGLRDDEEELVRDQVVGVEVLEESLVLLQLVLA